MSTKSDATSNANSIALANAAKRLEKKNQQRKELEALSLEDIFAFNEHIKENWLHTHQNQSHIQNQNQNQSEDQNPQNNSSQANQSITSRDGIQKTSHLLAAAQSFEHTQDQQIRQQLKKQLLRDYELGEHLFEIDIQDLGKISVNAHIQKDAWHFALSAEENQTKNWLQKQEGALKESFSEQAEKKQNEKISLSII